MLVTLVGAMLEDNLALGYLASSLRSAGHRVEMLAFDGLGDIPSLVDDIGKLEPGMVGMSVAFQHRVSEFRDLSRALREAGVEAAILGFDPDRSLAFTWNFPPHIPIRDEKTTVKLIFHALTGEDTRVEMIHSGWRDGPAWDLGYDYFDEAWDVVLARLQHRFLHGPVDWNALQTSQESS